MRDGGGSLHDTNGQGITGQVRIDGTADMTTASA